MTVGSRPIRNRKTRIVAGNERARDDQNESGARGEYRKAMKALIKRRGDRLQTSSLETRCFSLAQNDQEDYRTTPSSGELAVAYSFFSMRPAKYACLPAITACFIASAMSTGSCALAIPVFIRTASAPSSMAIAASEAVPTPASTIRGTPVITS